MTIRTTLRIVRLSRPRDIFRNRRFGVVRRFPGGRTIALGSASTRIRAFKQALIAGRAQTSPTAGGFFVEDASQPWQNNQPIVIGG